MTFNDDDGASPPLLTEGVPPSGASSGMWSLVPTFYSRRLTSFGCSLSVCCASVLTDGGCCGF